MTVSLICAVSENGVIGRDNTLPWHLPADLKHFRKLTMGHPIIMGRKTHQSIGRALPGRTNIVITRQEDFRSNDCLIVHSLSEALTTCQKEEEVFVIGGASVYREAFEQAHRLFLTKIHENFEGDTFLPTVDERIWRLTHREDFEADDKNPFAYSFLTLEKIV